MPQSDQHKAAAKRPAAAKRMAMAKRLAAAKRLASWRHRAYEVLEHGPVGDRAMRLVSRALIMLVLVNIVAVVWRGMPGVAHSCAARAGVSGFSGRQNLRGRSPIPCRIDG